MSRLAFASNSSDQVLWSEPQAGQIQLRWVSDSGPHLPESHRGPWRGVPPVGAVFLLLVGAALGTWLRMLIKRVFLPDLVCPPALPPVDWSSSQEINGNYLVCGHPRSQKSCRIAKITTCDPI